MSKTAIVKKIAKQLGCSQIEARNFLNAFCYAVEDSVANDETVTLTGFGTFYKSFRKATTGRHPRTGELINIKASNQPKFRAGKNFKEVVNGLKKAAA